MKTSGTVILACLMLIGAASAGFSRSLLGKKMYYTTVPAGKISEAKYWFVYLGQHECTLSRKFPGEETQKITGNMNLSLLSSGYIEGSGYSERGKIDCSPAMKIRTDSGDFAIDLDSIDFIFDFGQKVRTVKGMIGEFIIDIEGELKTANRFLLTEYKMTTAVDGERELKKTGDDIRLSAIAMSREGAARALRHMSSKPKTDTRPSLPPATR
ncbi:MAG: hypothetical protein JW699_03920 [Chitinispirillaceae bacterium]|nr:hypothetical protein [Chitinispirillaceae bacterium]